MNSHLFKEGIILSSLLTLSMGASAAGKEGTFNPLQTAVPSLQIAPDARGGGMGDVGVSTSPDVYSQFWNPAKYASMDSKGGVAISYTPWLRKIVKDINLAHLCGYYKIDDRQALGMSLKYFSYGEINLTDMPDPMGNIVSTGTSRPYELAIDLSYSRALSENWNAGVSLRFILSDLMNGVSDASTDYDAAKTVAADIACFYRKPIDLGGKRTATVTFGSVISNLGGKVSYDGGSTKQYIPAAWRNGAGFSYPFDAFNRVTVNFELMKLLVPTTPNSEDYYEYDETGVVTPESQAAYQQAYEKYLSYSTMKGVFKSFGDAPGGFREELREVMWSLGAEYSYNDMFMVRFGYYHENKYKGNRKYFAVGAGFRMRIFEIQAAYLIAAHSSSSCPIDRTLRFSLGFNFDGMKKLVEN